jgi:hypothetical protein
MRSNNISGKPELRGSHIYGFENRAHFINLYESFYGRNDKTLKNDDNQATNKVAPTSKTFRDSSTTSMMTAAAQSNTRVSNHTSRPLPTSSDPSASLPTTSSTAITPAPTRDSTALTQPTLPSTATSMVIHQGRTIDIVDLVQQLVTEQLAPLRNEVQDQATKQTTLQQTLLTQHIHDQEQLFLRLKAEHKKGLRDLQQLHRERAKYPDRSQEAQDLEGYIQQDQKDLEAQLENLKYIYVETIQEATTNRVPLSSLTGDEAKDF